MQDDDSLVFAASPQGSLLLVSGDSGILGSPAFTQSRISRMDPRGPTPHTSYPSTSWTSGNFMPSIFSPFGFSAATSHYPKPNRNSIPESDEQKDEVIDFTFVQESDADEVDILLSGGDPGTGQSESEPTLDALAVLLSGSAQNDSEQLVSLSEKATMHMNKAAGAKKKGNMQEAMDAHSAAARFFHEAAVVLRDKNASMAQSFLLLSQTEARSALGLKKIMKVRPNFQGTAAAQKDRIRETVRGALNSQPEADLSESVFLGKGHAQQQHQSPATSSAGRPGQQQQQNDETHSSNPVDEMMKLERELREMDMALEMGNSIASLDTKSRMKTMDGSFMVVPPGTGSYMSSSMVLGPSSPRTSAPRLPAAPVGAAGARARANRVQSISTHPNRRVDVPHQIVAPAPHRVVSAAPAPAPTTSNHQGGLESSWWGNSSVVSQSLASSVISLASVAPSTTPSSSDQAANNKQLMRLMDSLKRLGDENAALLREVEQAEAARAEAKAAKQEMRRFQQEYNKRFETLKNVLDKFRKNYQENQNNNNSTTTMTPNNPVLTSEFLISASTSEQLARQEQLIRKLTADLKREKDEAKKKEVIFRRYESFYREVKAMSAQKAAQRKKEQAQGSGAK